MDEEIHNIRAARSRLVTRLSNALQDFFSGFDVEDNDAFDEYGDFEVYKHGALIKRDGEDDEKDIAIVRRDDDVFELTTPAYRKIVIDPVDDDYSLFKSPNSAEINRRWPSPAILEGLKSAQKQLSEIGVYTEIEIQLEALEEAVTSFNPDKETIEEAFRQQDLEAIECTGATFLPDNRRQLSSDITQFGTNNPPVVQTFLQYTDGISVQFRDDDVTLIRGEWCLSDEDRPKSDWSLLLGNDDGGPFIHPFPPSLLVDCDNYDITRDDIRDILGYSYEWPPSDSIQSGEWYRVQGDLVMKWLSIEEITRIYQQREIHNFCDSIDVSSVIDYYQWSIEKDMIDVSTRSFLTAPSIQISNQTHYEGELAHMLGYSVDTWKENVEQDLINYAVETSDVIARASEQVESLLEDADENYVILPVDNHLVLMSDSSELDDSDNIFDNSNSTPELGSRDYEAFIVPNSSTLQVRHQEHETLARDLPSGVYLFSLLERRDS